MTELVQDGQYGAIITKNIATMGYYIIKFLSESYTLQEDTTCDIQIRTCVEKLSKHST